MKPLLLSKDLSLNTTMSELYEYNKKEIHVMFYPMVNTRKEKLRSLF
jgi:hypothetical protein